MSLLQANAEITEAQLLKKENDALKDRLARLSEASIGISGRLDTGDALQEVINSARNLTGARYGALVTFQPSGGVRDSYTCGLSQGQRESITQSPQGLGLPGYISKAKGPVRLKDMAAHPDSVGLSANHPPMKTFLGAPVYHRGEHVGNIYLSEKEGGQEFTEEDEHMAAMFAAQAASVISNTQRYEAEHRAKADLEALINISPVGVVVFDAQTGELAYINQEIRRMMSVLGFPEESMANAFEILSFRRADGRELSFGELPLTRVLQSGETVRAEEIIVHLPNGNEMTTLVNAGPIFSESGEILSVVTLMQDMTPLDDLERQRSEFLGMVSEELRTPLATIKGSADALRGIVGSMNPTEPRQLLRIIDQQTDLMRSQINSLIELTQIETGTLSVAPELAEVTELLKGSCGEFLRDHTVNSIEPDIPAGLPKVMVDKQRIGQVLRNFLRQAARYSNESSPIKVSAAMDDIYVVIAVSVEGPFDPAPEAPHLQWKPETPQTFKNLARSHAKLVEFASQGEGLAIAFCRGVVEAHGGRIRTDVDEQEGRLTLTFTLPSVEEEIQAPVMPEISGGPLPAPAEKTQIIVSIENPRLVNTVRRVLLNAGYGTAATADLDEVEQLALSGKAKLILLDIAGREEECFRTLRGARNFLNLPTIVLCDRDDEEYVVRAFDMGADGYMVKPFSPSELIARIKATLRRLTIGEEFAGKSTFQLGDVRIDFHERTVTVSGQPVQLTATEYKLLTELSNSAGRVLTQAVLLQRVWGTEYSGESDLLRSYIKTLRRKLGDNARKPSYIFTEYGVGYRMAKP